MDSTNIISMWVDLELDFTFFWFEFEFDSAYNLGSGRSHLSSPSPLISLLMLHEFLAICYPIPVLVRLPPSSFLLHYPSLESWTLVLASASSLVLLFCIFSPHPQSMAPCPLVSILTLQIVLVVCVRSSSHVAYCYIPRKWFSLENNNHFQIRRKSSL